MKEPTQGTENKFAPAMIMSLFSILPFVGCALALILLGKDNPVFNPVLDMFKTWSAIILAFMGGVRWGSTVFAEIESPSRMSAATLLPVAGWLALFITGPFGVLTLLLIYCAQGAWDSFSGGLAREPGWYTTVRITFVLTIVACHMVVFVAVY